MTQTKISHQANVVEHIFPLTLPKFQNTRKSVDFAEELGLASQSTASCGLSSWSTMSLGTSSWDLEPSMLKQSQRPRNQKFHKTHKSHDYGEEVGLASESTSCGLSSCSLSSNELGSWSLSRRCEISDQPMYVHLHRAPPGLERVRRNSYMKIQQRPQGIWHAPAQYQADDTEKLRTPMAATGAVQPVGAVPQSTRQAQAEFPADVDVKKQNQKVNQRMDKQSRQLLKAMPYCDAYHLILPLLECKAGKLGFKEGSIAVLKALESLVLPTPLSTKAAIKQHTFLTKKLGSMSFFALAMMLSVRDDGPPKVLSGEARDALLCFRSRLQEDGETDFC